MRACISLSDGLIDIAPWHPDELIVPRHLVLLIEVQLEFAICYVSEGH